MKGNDIVSVDDFVNAVTGSTDKIKMFSTLSDTEKIDELLEPNLKSNCMKIHQLLWAKIILDTLSSISWVISKRYKSLKVGCKK